MYSTLHFRFILSDRVLFYDLSSLIRKFLTDPFDICQNMRHKKATQKVAFFSARLKQQLT